MTPEIDSGWMGAVLGAGGLAGALLYVRRQLSRDQTGIAADKSERSQISRLEEEIKRLADVADKASAEAASARAEKTSDKQRIAGLESENAFITRERDRLMRDIKRAVRGLSPDRRAFLETDFSALADVAERIEPGA